MCECVICYMCMMCVYRYSWLITPPHNQVYHTQYLSTVHTLLLYNVTTLYTRWWHVETFTIRISLLPNTTHTQYKGVKLSARIQESNLVRSFWFQFTINVPYSYYQRKPRESWWISVALFLSSAYIVSPGPTSHKKLSCGLFVTFQWH